MQRCVAKDEAERSLASQDVNCYHEVPSIITRSAPVNGHKSGPTSVPTGQRWRGASYLVYMQYSCWREQSLDVTGLHISEQTCSVGEDRVTLCTCSIPVGVSRVWM